jgi:hypothetical protein
VEIILRPAREKPGAFPNVRVIRMPARYEGESIDPRLFCFEGQSDISRDVH